MCAVPCRPPSALPNHRGPSRRSHITSGRLDGSRSQNTLLRKNAFSLRRSDRHLSLHLWISGPRQCNAMCHLSNGVAIGNISNLELAKAKIGEKRVVVLIVGKVVHPMGSSPRRRDGPRYDAP